MQQVNLPDCHHLVSPQPHRLQLLRRPPDRPRWFHQQMPCCFAFRFERWSSLSTVISEYFEWFSDLDPILSPERK